jgi:hypothetical protein
MQAMQQTYLLAAALSIAACLLAPAALAQGPISGFKGPRGTTDLAINYGTESFSTYLFGTAERRTPLTTESFNLFVEHNFTDTLALVFNLPYVWIDEANRGLQDANLFLKYRNKHQQYSHGYLNLITSVGLTFPASAYPTDTDTPIGIRALAFHGRFSAQYASYGGFFVQLQSGLDFRLVEEMQVALPVLLRAGYGGRYYYVEGWLEQFITLNDAVDEQITGGAGSDWTRLGATLYLPMTPKIGAVLGGAWIVQGRNIGLSARWNAGLVYRLARR